MTPEKVKELRARTGAGVLDSRNALKEAGGDVEAAILLLRKRGQAQAAKKAIRPTQEGIIASYVHGNGKVAVLVTLLCETDFVARNERFKELARNIALHIAAMEPTAVRPEDIAEDVVAAERAIGLSQAAASGKPAAIQEKMVEGRLTKFKAERALLTQPYVKNPSQTVADVINEAVSELGENISVGEFSRLTI
jgi:elongation factor Ts